MTDKIVFELFFTWFYICDVNRIKNLHIFRKLKTVCFCNISVNEVNNVERTTADR